MTLDPVFPYNNVLRNRLSDAIPRTGRDHVLPLASRFAVASLSDTDLNRGVSLNIVVTGNEVNNQHGTGPLVKRVCQGWPNIFSIRARNDWGGVQDFGDWHVCLSPRATTRDGFFRNVLSILRSHTVETILCIPFLPDEFYISIALQECFGAKLCTYLMDDQNVAASCIPDALMSEFLQRCSLRLVTHPELRYIYEQKYSLPFHILPAIVPSHLISASVPEHPVAAISRGALIGSFWDQTWFDRMCGILGRCGRVIDWFGNNKSPWFDLRPQELEKAGIVAHGVIPEDLLARKLAEYPFVIVPVGALDAKESNTGVARLSLPGRILFAIAMANTPVLIVGSPHTCGARFVTHFGVGEVVPYDARAVSAAMARMSEPDAQKRMRDAAAKIAPLLSDAGIGEWLRGSIALGHPIDQRFERMFLGYNAAIEV